MTMPASSKRRTANAIIATASDISKGCRALSRRCVHMRAIHDQLGDPPLRRSESGFPGLARIVVGQQLSIASADAIWTRVKTAIDPLEPHAMLSLDEAAMRGLGLSRPKIRTLRAIASATASGEICFADLPDLSESEIRNRLTAIPGIGPWSADIYLMFCLGARDAFAPGDLALQEAVRMVYGRESRPGPDELEAIAERWRPWRGVAARLLWADYAHRRARPER
ncbi:MAG: DNA-3-methyladenine glycosylase 2 family protein [Alphaproteobacteria bacterium]|nr:DNA-3-methyladenine glycosylase 2 family protein [Alphaproteobacteria bacterium]